MPYLYVTYVVAHEVGRRWRLLRAFSLGLIFDFSRFFIPGKKKISGAARAQFLDDLSLP